MHQINQTLLDDYSKNKKNVHQTNIESEAEFKEFEPRLKFKPLLKYGWFHLKLYLIFKNLSRRSIKIGF